MAQTTWVADAPSGVYKNHTMSRNLYEAAIAETVFMSYVRPEPSFGRKRGESVTSTRYSTPTEPTTSRLIEQERIPEYPFTLSTIATTVTEFGGGIPYTNLYDELSEFDMETPIQKVLRNLMSLAMDTAAATAFKTAKVKYAPTGVATATVTTNGVFGATATAGMNVYHVEELVDLMYDTYFMPPYEDGDYVGIFRNRSITSVMRDPAWEKWHIYTNPQSKYNNEVGRLHGMRFVRTNHANALGNVGTGGILGEGVVFGDDPVLFVEAMAPELRAGIPTDAGRSKIIYWYGIFDYGIVWDTANAGEARIIHVGSL